MSEQPPPVTLTRRPTRLRAVLTNPLAVIGLIMLGVVLIAFIAALAIGWVDPHSPLEANLRNLNAPPGSPGHLLGTDNGGRDVFVRLVVATKSTLLSATVALGVAVLLGIPSGLVAGYYGGRIDLALDWLSTLLLSLPGLLVLMAIIAGLGNSMWITMSALGVLMTPGVFRVIRAQVHAIRSELYIDAAKVAGLHDARIIARHVFGMVRGPLLLMLTVLSAVAITVQTGLDFIGLGNPNIITWGGMLSEGFNALFQNQLLFLWPGLALSLTIMALFLLGNGLRDALQPGDTRAAPARRIVRRGHPTDRAAASEPPAADAILCVRDLRIGYPAGDSEPVEVVRGVTLELRKGRIMGLVGESGSGKTQTAFAVLDLLPRQARLLSAQIWLDGVDLRTLTPAQRERLVRESIAYVPQEPMSNLDPAFTIGYQLTEPLRARGLSRGAARERAVGLLARTGIGDPDRVMRCYPHQISGGMAQRVLIAGAISTEPRILIADEPTTALDVTVQSEILDLLRELRTELSMSILLVTHDLGVVADLCDDVAVMRSGEIVETRSVREFFGDPAHDYSRELLAAVPDEDHVRADYVDAASEKAGVNG
ncbi:dipeptide/oligopeptide/nickel ABC transporter permease/ATP-binding protein [Nocardia uniformis]|uniref:Dipeptide/oligopeptide/nickel ABC transporter permease/ATP-binding protein n=1 Tax=Nocardia uniformis TaxID=53432 RepID=A0A849C2S1_9NOCA|nr:dipeptide/oligopeptide/nickel ABC transporter permease/ATP-binding protein [Nocardia uniformis]NNH69279.1 dipeptide/oligopeptide/nickel ABC transporter permease/ATP-binding protein [Nocardia uniformis]